MSKEDPEKSLAEVESIKKELQDLEIALAELVEALIAEEKPGLKRIKKLRALKKQSLENRPLLAEDKTKEKEEEQDGSDGGLGK